MIRKKKGFTLVELLATIIILGLLVTIAYISVSSILNSGDDSYYESQENMLVLAGREYYADHRSELPKEIGDTSNVSLETLVEENYIEQITDKDGNDCDNDNSGVTVQKITEKDFQYYGTLICGAYQTNSDKAKPAISFDPNKKSSENPITVTMKVTDNKEVKSYRYVITKDGEEYQDSGYQTYNGDVTINLTELGLYKITGYAIDSSGNTSTRRSGQYSVHKGIDCSQVQISSSIKAGSITNQDISISYKLPSNTYRVELSKRINGGEYESIGSYMGNTIPNVVLDTEGINQVKAVLYDKDGKSCTAATDEYTIDKTGPELNVISKKKTSSTDLTSDDDISNLEDYTIDSWHNGYVVLRGSCSDNNGKCTVSYKVTGASTNTDGYVEGDTRNINASGTSEVVFRATDEAGNVTERTYTVKLDRTSPTLSVALKKKANSTDLGSSSNINSLSNYSNNSWYNGYVVLRGSCSDAESNCSISYQVTGASTNTDGFVNGTTRNINAQGTSKIVYRATDEAGNSVTKEYTVKLDRIKPVLYYTLSNASGSANTASGNSSGGNITKNYTSTVNVIRKFSATDSGESDISTYQYKNSSGSWKTETKYSSYTITSTNKATYRVMDKAGNYSNTITLNVTINKNTTKKMYLCRNGDTFINWRKSTSCANVESNKYNCAYYITSNIKNPTSVEVKSELDGDYYVLVHPVVKTFDGEQFTFKYIYKNCLTTDSTPADCTKACLDH